MPHLNAPANNDLLGVGSCNRRARYPIEQIRTIYTGPRLRYTNLPQSAPARRYKKLGTSKRAANQNLDGRPSKTRKNLGGSSGEALIETMDQNDSNGSEGYEDDGGVEAVQGGSGVVSAGEPKKTSTTRRVRTRPTVLTKARLRKMQSKV